MSDENFNFTMLPHSDTLQPHQVQPLVISTSTHANNDGINNIQDNLLPIANIGRIMKDVLPPTGKISKRAKETIQECATEFVGFVTGEASERCRRERRKTINGDDICHAMMSLGLDHYADAMRVYLQRYRESEELTATLNRSTGREIHIDVRDELSVFRNNDKLN